MLKQNFAIVMIQHRLERICSVVYTRSLDLRMSSKLPNATSIEFFVQHVIIVAHVGLSMNLTRRQ